MNTRLERVGRLIRDEISDILRRDIHDPLIGFISITEVKVSADLHHATVFFSVLGEGQQVQDCIKGLLRARKYINARVAERIDLRYIPKLRFQLDETAAKAQRMEALLREQASVIGEAPPPSEEPAPEAAPDEDEDEEDWDDDDEDDDWDEDDEDDDLDDEDDEDGDDEDK